MIYNDYIFRNGFDELNERQTDILKRIIQLYILKAAPVGSRALAKFIEREISLSPATLRNIMSDLEEREFITHPHTSAGRVPTDKGYRFYVNAISGSGDAAIENITIPKVLGVSDSENILRDASKLLSMLSQFLGVVKIPTVVECKVQKIEIINLGYNKILVVIALDSNIVKTVTLEARFDTDAFKLYEISNYINEKISGKTLAYIREHFRGMMNEIIDSEAHIIRLFTESLDRIFDNKDSQDRILMGGAQNLLAHPEFDDKEKVRSVIELIENEDIVIHLLDTYDEPGGIKVLIGGEMHNDILDDYSLVVTSYNIGAAKGSIGLIGPKRMNYPKMMSIVKSVADSLSNMS